MTKKGINKLLKRFVENNINPSQTELNFVRKIYADIKKILGEGNCYRIGSWPRGTAITPLHDLDVLYVVRDNTNDFDTENPPNPFLELKKTADLIRENLEPPSSLIIDTEIQSHSCRIVFKKHGNIEIFSVDIVPGYIATKIGPNEQGQDMYYVPEINYLNRKEQGVYYEKIANENKEIRWKLSDPRGYIEPTRILKKRNEDFIYSVKFIKAWKNSVKKKDDDFKLKSFHLNKYCLNILSLIKVQHFLMAYFIY